MTNGVTGVATTAASWVRTPRPPALHGQSGGRPSALLRMRTMSKTLIRASTAQVWSSMLAAHLWKGSGGASGGPLTRRVWEEVIGRTPSRTVAGASAVMSAFATPVYGGLPPEMLMGRAGACRVREGRGIGHS